MIDPIGTLREITKMAFRPKFMLGETWQDEAGIDPVVWTLATGGTGAVARSVAEPPYLKVVLSGPTNADTAWLYSNMRWFTNPDGYGPHTILKRVVLEWEWKMATVASILESMFFMGLAETQLVDRGQGNLIGFILDAVADELYSITDDGVGETTKDTGLDAADLLSWHKSKIEVYGQNQQGLVDFYIDEELVTTHTTLAAEDLPDTAMYIALNMIQQAGANGGELHTGPISLWLEDIVRQKV